MRKVLSRKNMVHNKSKTLISFHNTNANDSNSSLHSFPHYSLHLILPLDAELFTGHLRSLDTIRDLLECNIPREVGAAMFGLDVSREWGEPYCRQSISLH